MQKYKLETKNDLKKRCYKFSLEIIQLVATLPNKISSRTIGNQLIRCATSIGANLVEARASSSRLEFKKFFEIALKSANETKFWLYLLRDAKLVDNSKINQLLKETKEISNMLAAGVIKLKNKKF